MSLHSLVVKIVGDNKQFNETIANTEKKLSETTKGLETVANNMTSVGDSMTKGITLPLAAAGAVLLKIGTDFDDAYDKIRIGSGATGEALEGLKEDFKEVAKDSASSFDDISSAIADYNTRLGLTGKPLQELSKQITNVSRITETDLNTNITQSAKLFNNWQIATEKQSKTLDLMFVASQQTGIGIDRLMTSVTEYGPILRGMGYDLESATALIAGFDKAGVNVQETLATMKIAMRNLAKEGFTDPQEALSMYIEKIENAGSSIEATRIAAELFGSRGGAVMGAAIREGRLELDDLIESLKTSKETINAVAEETDDWKENLTKLKNEAMIQLEPIANKVFDSLGRAVEGISPKIKELAGWFGNLTDSQTDNILKWGLLIAAIGPAISIIGRTTTGIIQLRNNILLLNTAVKASPILMGSVVTASVAGMVAVLGMYFTAMYNAGNANMEAAEKIKEKEKADNDAVIAEKNRQVILEGTTQTLRALTDEEKENIKTIELSLQDYQDYTQRQQEAKEAILGVKEATEESTLETTKNKIANEQNKTMIDDLMRTYDLTEEAAKEYAEAEGLLASATDDATEAIDGQTKSIDKLRNEFNKLISDIFGHITTYNDFEEANIAVREAEKALAEAIKEHGKQSDEAVRAQNNLDNAMINSIQTSFELSTSIKATAEQQKEARQKAIELGLEFINTGQIGVDQFWEMASEFGLSSTEIIRLAGEMGLEIDEATRDRLTVLDIDDVVARAKMNEYIKLIANIPTSIQTKVEARANIIWSSSKGAMDGGIITPNGVVQKFANGGIAGYKKGGIIDKVLSASSGMITPSYDNGGILSLLHKNEVVLNSKQTRNLAELIFGLANTRFAASQEYGNTGQPLIIKNVIELDGSIIYEKTEEHLYRSQRLKQIGAGIR